MATFAHFATGLAAGRLPAHSHRRPRLVQAAFGLAALLPDLDAFIPGLRHDGPTGRSHTPIATVGLSAVSMLVARSAGLPPLQSFAAALVAIGSQPVLDAFTHGKGEAIAWPLSRRRYFRRVPGLPTWKPEKGLSRWGMRSFLAELAWALPLFAVAALPLPSDRHPGGEEESLAGSAVAGSR